MYTNGVFRMHRTIGLLLLLASCTSVHKSTENPSDNEVDPDLIAATSGLGSIMEDSLRQFLQLSIQNAAGRPAENAHDPNADPESESATPPPGAAATNGETSTSGSPPEGVVRPPGSLDVDDLDAASDSIPPGDSGDDECGPHETDTVTNKGGSEGDKGMFGRGRNPTEGRLNFAPLKLGGVRAAPIVAPRGGQGGAGFKSAATAPTLRLHSISIQPARVVAGTKVTLRFKIENRGVAALKGVRLSCLVDGRPCNSRLVDVPAMGSLCVEIRLDWTATMGRHRLTIRAHIGEAGASTAKAFNVQAGVRSMSHNRAKGST